MIQEDVFIQYPSQTFITIKDKINSGDLLFCSGNSIISSMIKESTGSIFSHVGLILRLPITGQWLVLESVESLGVRCVTLLEGYVKNYQDTGRGYDGKVLIARHKDMQHKVALYEKLYQRAFELTGDKYSRADIFRIASRIALNKIGIHENGLVKEDNRYICSEYVYACLKAIDIHLPYNPLGFIAPADIAHNQAIFPICQLAVDGWLKKTVRRDLITQPA